MFVPETPGPARQIVIGAAVSLLVFGALALMLHGCGAATPMVVQCKLDALKVLPEDPQMVTPYDAVDLINRLKACHAPADGGVP
jgi:hypothetical protein